MTLEFMDVSEITVTSSDGKIMSDRDLKERIFQRHDQFDYQKFIIDEHWYVRPTIVMLTSFCMEVNGLFDQGDPVETFAKIHFNYFNYIVYGGLCGGDIKYTNMDDGDYKPGEVNLDSARFGRESLLNYIENNNLIRLDVGRLKRFISGEEKPSIHNNQEQCERLVENAVIANKYVFRDMNATWFLAYEGKNTTIRDSLGMKYLAELIKHKNTEIGWFELYAAVKGADPDQIGVDAPNEDIKDFSQNDGKLSSVYAGKDIKALRREIMKLEEKLEEAKEYGDLNAVDNIQQEIDDINKYILDSYNKDGTLKESSGNREKIINSIKTAISRALKEIEKPLPDLRKHLHNTIVVHWQRSKPSYSPTVDIEWQM